MSDPMEQTGTGEPRSAEAQGGAPTPQPTNAPPADPAVSSGAHSTSNPAFSEEVTPNRSGSGGSGGPAEGASGAEEGSGDRTMEELLGGDAR
jgi:hypothetical protein